MLDSPRSTSRVDIEAQVTESNNHGRKSQTLSLRTAGSCQSTPHGNSPEHREEHPNATPPADWVRDQDVTETPNTIPHVDIPSSPHGALPTDTPARPEWKSWKADEPLITKIPESKTTKEDWVKAMDASDEGMCKGWKDSIDTLIIFAGLFSATVTAFTVESYQWLNETPADTLARLQLRDLLNTTHNPNPVIDRLAPAAFHVSPASVAINTLWFASLTLSLGAVVISILCKQWLHEYQRYDNFTLDEAFLVRGLRHRGLQAWKVPEIISSLPILLQVALVLFLAGILVLLWPLQIIVVSTTTTIVGLTFLFLIITTALPSLQYIFPIVNTQCPYKSSQSWSFLRISAFWLFDFGEFMSWATFDRWEVTCVHSGMGHTLSRVYKLLENNVDAVLSIYTFLVDTSLRPATQLDFALLSDFVDGLDASQRLFIGNATSPDTQIEADLSRIRQLKHHLQYSHPFQYHMRVKTGDSRLFLTYSKPRKSYTNYSWAQLTSSKFLQSGDYTTHPALFNRYIEHWGRGFNIQNESTDIGFQSGLLMLRVAHKDHLYDPDIAMFLIELCIHLFETDQFGVPDFHLLFSGIYPKLMESCHQHNFNPSPATLLRGVQDWVNQVPKSDLSKKASYAGDVLFFLSSSNRCISEFTESHKSNLERQYLVSFMHFFLGLYEGEDPLPPPPPQHAVKFNYIRGALAFFHKYLLQHPDISQ